MLNEPSLRARARDGALFRNLRIPVIAAPMFLVSGTDYAIAAARAGIVGAFPALNARSSLELEQWLSRIQDALDPRRDAIWGVNLVVHRSNAARLDSDMALVEKYRVPLVITSIGDPSEIVARVHAYGGIVLHDVTTLRFARKAASAGADGLILVCGGAGGNAGRLNPFAFLTEVREFWDGILVLAGGISTGRAIRAATMLGADLVYMGTRFLAAEESMAAEDYKRMAVEARAEDIIYTNAFSGIWSSVLRPSVVRAGLDPDNLPDPEAVDLSRHLNPDLRKWRDIWGAGQGVGAVKSRMPVAQIVDELAADYANNEILNKEL